GQRIGTHHHLVQVLDLGMAGVVVAGGGGGQGEQDRGGEGAHRRAVRHGEGMVARKVMLYYYDPGRGPLSTNLRHAPHPPPSLAGPVRRRGLADLRTPLRPAAAADRGIAFARPGQLAERRRGTGLRGVRHRALRALVLLLPGLAVLWAAVLYAPLHDTVVPYAVAMTFGGTLVGLGHLVNLRLNHGHVHDASCTH